MFKKIILLVIIVFSVTICLIVTNNYSSKEKTEGKQQVESQNEKVIERITIPQSDYDKIELDYQKLSLVPKKSELYFNHVYNDILYLSVLDEKNNLSKPLMTTPKLITYNLKTKESKIYDYDYDIRIWDYIIKNDAIYFTTIEYTNDNKIEWSLVYSDLNFNNQKILKQGEITDGLMSPNIILDNENIYVVTINESDYNKEYSFYKINSDNSIKQLLTIDNSIESIHHPYRTVIKDENIYYMAYNKTRQFLYKYDYKNNEKDIIFSIDNGNSTIFDFLVMDDYYMIDLAEKNDNSSLIFKYNNGTVLNVNDSIFLTSFRKVSENKFLTHNNDKKNNTRIFKLFNSNGEVEKIFNFENLSLNYKYMVYDSNYIIMTNYDPNEIYIYDIRKLK